jgi:nitrate/nitrite transport system permease protein
MKAKKNNFLNFFTNYNFLLPIIGFVGVIALWWVIALFRGEMMPTPPEALAKNLDFILHPFYRRGPGDLGLGWLLLASLRRVLIGFFLGAIVAKLRRI